ncbi:DUF11 domain-containing protein [Kribbella antibiotica]|uniref:DUF11 domain-containing protein n=1 Tax=Kribbella antibiotica TaxID=190195 RepID=UPI0014052E35|nr:DUF11 domain-containing protein [Kribbella antibiotica]
MHALKSLCAALVTVVASAVLIAPGTALAADPPSSAIEVSDTSLNVGQEFTITQTVHNSASFTIVGAKAALFGKTGVSLPSMIELVGCTGATICFPLDIEFRAALGDLPSGATRTIVYTFKVLDTAPESVTLQHQLLGDEYSFELFEGATLTFAAAQVDADISVGLTGSASGGRINYTVTVKNNGPAPATGINVAAAYPSGLSYVGASGCTRVGTTRNLNCGVASLAGGASVTKTFSASAGLLTTGSFVATAQRTASSPTDPVAANDKASKSCSILLGLLVRC